MDNHQHPSNKNIQRCPRFSAPVNTIVVHGHEACAFGKSNIFECCTGDVVGTDANLDTGYKRA